MAGRQDIDSALIIIFFTKKRRKVCRSDNVKRRWKNLIHTHIVSKSLKNSCATAAAHATNKRCTAISANLASGPFAARHFYSLRHTRLNFTRKISFLSHRTGFFVRAFRRESHGHKMSSNTNSYIYLSAFMNL